MLLLAKFEDRRPVFPEKLEEYENMWDVYRGRIHVAKHRIDLLNDDVRPVHSASYRAGQTARKFSPAETDRMISEKLIEPANTKWEASIVLDPKKGGFFCICVDSRRLIAFTIR